LKSINNCYAEKLQIEGKGLNNINMKDKIYNYDKQHLRGKLHALERINYLVDKDSFHEIGGEVCKYREENHECLIPYDGVITGYAYINDKLIYVYAQDFTVCGGTVGLKHGNKIKKLIQMAIKSKCPIIGINDSGGARIQEGVNALAGYGNILYYNSLASGYIPQISIIAGPCAGGAVYSPGITDFVFMMKGISHMYVTGPKVIEKVTGQVCDAEELGGSNMHFEESGIAHFISNSEIDCFKSVRKLITMLPSNCHEKMLYQLVYQEKDIKEIKDLLPKETKKVYNICRIIEMLADDNSFMEIQSRFAPNIVIGFAKVCNITVGFVANQPQWLGGVLDCDASIKAARFVRYCDAYSIPIITLVDVPGFLPSMQQERNGIIRNGAKLLYSFAEATTIKITIILRKAYGGAYIAMCSKHLNADYVYCWPGAEIAVMGAEGALEILHSKEMKELEESKQKLFKERYIAEYESKYVCADMALKEGYIDGEIEPEDTRKIIFDSICSLSNSEEMNLLNKKHNTMPL